MSFSVYELGKAIPYDFSIPSVDKKLRFVYFPYSAKDVVLTSALIIAGGFLLAFFLQFLSSFFYTTFFFLGLVGGVVAFVYPVNIFYTHKLMEYREEMLRGILHISTYIQTGTSIESSFAQAEDSLHGILKIQFHDINTMLSRKTKNTLGDALNVYVNVWNEINPQFVKGIRLLQLASLSSDDDKTRLINETIETLMVSYTVMGKRSAEKLSKKTGMLIGAGLMLPIMSLLGLPILAIFMPQMVQPAVISFVYIVFFPTVVLVAALSFASERIQIDTIRIKDAMSYTPFPRFFLYISIAIVVFSAIPTGIVLYSAYHSVDILSDSFLSFFYAWCAGGGIMFAIYFYAFFYVRKYEKLWNEIHEIESDLPFMLQSFSTYFTLNTPFEKVIDGVVDDYTNLGFKDHPAVKAFTSIKRLLYSTKMTVQQIMHKQIHKLIPSGKVRSVLMQIVGYEAVSQESAAKAARMVREQVLSTYKLDDYIKTLLADTIGFLKVGISMLAPLLGAAAVVMTYAILKSTVFITQQLENISQLFGGQKIELTLVDLSSVISPLFIQVIVSIYVLEMIIVLSIFQTQISTGSDMFQMMKDLKSNVLSFLLYSLLMFGGYYFINEVLFTTIMVG